MLRLQIQLQVLQQDDQQLLNLQSWTFWLVSDGFRVLFVACS